MAPRPNWNKAIPRLVFDRAVLATIGRAAGVPKDSIRRFLNHSGGDVTDHYIRDSGLARLHAAEQETISAAIVHALGTHRCLI
jgi:hypothetical protein